MHGKREQVACAKAVAISSTGTVVVEGKFVAKDAEGLVRTNTGR